MSPIADCHICLFIRYPIFQHIYKPIISRCFLQETIKGDIAGGPGDVRLRRPEWNVDIRTVRARQGLNIQKKDTHRRSLFCIIESTRRRRTSGGRSPATTGVERRHSNRSSPAGLEHTKKRHPSDVSFLYL